LAGVTRSTFYAPHLTADPDELEFILLGEIDAEYTRHPFFGSRKMTVYLCGIGHRLTASGYSG
jgi:putative transposase